MSRILKITPDLKISMHVPRLFFGAISFAGFNNHEKKFLASQVLLSDFELDRKKKKKKRTDLTFTIIGRGRPGRLVVRPRFAELSFAGTEHIPRAHVDGRLLVQALFFLFPVWKQKKNKDATLK